MYNKYWNLSWWYIFDLLDKEAHRVAIENIGECVTISSNINFFKEVKDKELIKTYYYREKVIWNKFLIDVLLTDKTFSQEVYAKASFIFITRK